MNLDNLNDKKMNLQIEKIKVDFVASAIQIIDENIRKRMTNISNNLEYASKRFLIYLSKDEDKLKNVDSKNEHNILFNEFLKDPSNEDNLRKFTNYCKDNEIKINQDTLDDIVDFHRIEILLKNFDNKAKMLEKHCLPIILERTKNNVDTLSSENDSNHNQKNKVK